MHIMHSINIYGLKGLTIASALIFSEYSHFNLFIITLIHRLYYFTWIILT
jgi:hypothetical protein